jgi:hypothetical protein
VAVGLRFAKFGPVKSSYGNVLLPSGLVAALRRPEGTRMDEQTGGRNRYRYGKFWHKLYGAKLSRTSCKRSRASW